MCFQVLGIASNQRALPMSTIIPEQTQPSVGAQDVMHSATAMATMPKTDSLVPACKGTGTAADTGLPLIDMRAASSVDAQHGQAELTARELQAEIAAMRAQMADLQHSFAAIMAENMRLASQLSKIQPDSVKQLS